MIWQEKLRDVDAKYLYLDVISFTKDRTIEAQSEIIRTFNKITKVGVQNTYGWQRPIYLPTGDGLCIAFVQDSDSFDVHLRTALVILERLATYNAKQTDPMRQFELRIGLNENRDNLLRDINNRENLAGYGINMAKRIMDLADGNMILVGHSVHERLGQRQSYYGKFREHRVVIHHGIELTVYQFVDDELAYLNSCTGSNGSR